MKTARKFKAKVGEEWVNEGEGRSGGGVQSPSWRWVKSCWVNVGEEWKSEGG